MRSILDTASETIRQRGKRYGTRGRNFADIAQMWSVILGYHVTPKQVALCMIAMKITREIYKAGLDNLVDICGYADCAADLEGYYDAKPDPEDGV